MYVECCFVFLLMYIVPVVPVVPTAIHRLSYPLSMCSCCNHSVSGDVEMSKNTKGKVVDCELISLEISNL